MGVMLPFRFTRFAALITVLLSIFISGNVRAQVALTDASLFQISFTLDETITDNGRAVLSLADITGAVDPSDYVNVAAQNPGAELPPLFYVDQMNGRIAVSAFKPSGADTDEFVYAYLSLRNETERDLSGLIAAFDFLYRPENGMQGVIILQVRTGNRPWQDVAGSRMRLTDLSASGPGEWQSFSVQTAIENIFSRPGDNIEFRWILDSPSRETLPLAIQGIELMAKETAVTPLEPGSLIITEIFAPPGESGSEYIELYNPTATPLKLTGLTVSSGLNSFVIQHDVEIQPYGYFVLAESGIQGLIENAPLYIYYGPVLSPGSGFIELYMGGVEAARASYDISDPLSAAELNRTASAFDGYASMQDFNLSTTDMGNGISGSPGFRGNSLRHFSTTLQGGHSYLAAIPGVLTDNLNRTLFSETDIRNLDGDPISPEDLLPGRPYLFRSDNDSRQIQLYAEETGTGAFMLIESPLKTQAGDGEYSYLTLPAMSGLTLSGLLNEFNQPIVPAALTWQPESERFEVIYSDAVALDSWNVLIINEDIPQPLVARSQTELASPLDRIITFSIFEENGSRQETLLDQSFLTFMPDYWTSSGQRYDLPKLMPLPSAVEPGDERESSFFYLRNAESNQQLNSFTHLPFEPSEDYQLSADIRSTQRSMQTVLRWTLTDDIPDEWIITLTDRITGQQINMREQSVYRFRHSGAEPLAIGDGDEEGSPVRTLQAQPPADDRFSIIISPYESPLGLQEVTEQPGTVELRQNYPNPFNPTTNIVYFIPDNRQIRIGVYNVVGQQVATLVDEVMSAGEHTATWNASDMPSGIYIVQLESGNQVFTRKITLIK